MAISVPDSIRPLRRAEYDRLVASGAFASEHIELLEGVLVRMSPSGAPHSSAVQKLNALLLPALVGRAAVRIQSPFAALDASEPEPDVAVVPVGDYYTEHPMRAYLVIEVAESSLDRDRGIKQRIYARAGVPDYWVVDVRGRCIEVYRDAGLEGYRSTRRIEHGGSIALVEFGDIVIRVADILR